MGDFAGASKSFLAELTKALDDLPPASSRSFADRLEITKLCKTLSNSIEYYNGKVPNAVLYPKVLEAAEALVQRGHLGIGKELYGYVQSKSPVAAAEGPDPNSAEYEIRSTLGLAHSSALRVLEEDRDVALPDTLFEVQRSLEVLRRGVARALEREEFYWMLYNGTRYTVDICRAVFLAAGQEAVVLPYLVFAALSLEANIRLSLPRFLPWRCEVYSAAVQCFRSLGATTEALKFVDNGIERVRELEELQKLDPLPCPPETLAVRKPP
jgi:hypothetical protein